MTEIWIAFFRDPDESAETAHCEVFASRHLALEFARKEMTDSGAEALEERGVDDDGGVEIHEQDNDQGAYWSVYRPVVRTTLDWPLGG